MNIKERENLVRESLKKFMGLPPYNSVTNKCMNDGYFYESIIREHGKRLVQRIANELEVQPKADEEPTIANEVSTDLAVAVKEDKLALQSKVDEYIRLHEQYKEIERELESLRDSIQPVMQEQGTTKLRGTNGGSIQVVTQERPTVTARYSTYDLTEVEPFLSARAKKLCIVKAIDREKLEALVKTGEVDEEIQNLKKVTPQVFIKVDHR